MALSSHPALSALSAVLADAAATLQVPVQEVTVELMEARVWPDTGMGLPGGGGRALTPGYLVRLGDGTIYRTDQQGHVARDESNQDPDHSSGPRPDTEIRLRYTEEGGITGRPISFETDSTRLSEDDEAELIRLVTECDFFNIRNAKPGPPIPDGVTTRLWIARSRWNHEVVRGDGLEMEDTEAFHALVAWVAERIPPRFPGSAMHVE
ncbi:MAG: hypothetical protein Q4P07_03770 [Ornithinimicrobium sp.]|uniref:hypothetical protein n=1 Tax=Ornithinimicrobium sp. TaxID=1977084 RepID=UPI0026DEA917|nr:hypothetical protein [Ornithinimicrobium sp.]MDO5739246.1 hypothetical protein [Ornithinimicrobium sp.]